MTRASMQRLTARQQRFVDEYLVDLNATRAAIRAGYSARTADRIGPELLGKTCVSAAISAAKAARAEKVRMDSERVLQRLVDMAEADLADLYDDQGNLLHPNQWPEVWRQGLVVGVETFTVPKGVGPDGKIEYAEVRKVRFADRLRVLELIGKHVNVGAFREQVGLSNPEGGPVQVEDKSTAKLAALLAKLQARRAGIS